MNGFRKYPVLVVLIFSHLLFWAQENNYWNSQFGAKSTLLGGAAVSSYLDNGALFYNPATLCFKDSGDLAVSANIYQIEDIKMTNAIGDGLDVAGSNYVIAPQIISGNLMITRKFEMGFIFLTRNNVDFSINKSHQGFYSLYPSETGILPFNFIADYSLRNRILEQWAGVALSYTINDKWGIGITNFLGYRYQKYIKGLTATAIYTDTAYTNYGGYVEKYDYQREVTYDNLNYILKAGIAYNGEILNAGLSVTLPSANIFGLGKSNYYRFDNNISVLHTTDSSQYSNLVFDKENRLAVVYKTPLSVALGIAIKFPKTKIYLSAEYFHSLNSYDLIKPQHNNNLTTVKNSVQYNSADVVGVTKSARPLLNFGMGYERKLSGSVSLLMGFHSDFNSVGPYNATRSEDEISVSYFNIWHATAGAAFMHSKRTVTIGIAGAYGVIKGEPQVSNFTAPSDETLLLGTTSDISTCIYRSLGLVLGVVF